MNGIHCHDVIQSLCVECDYREYVVEDLDLSQEPHKMDSAVANRLQVFGRVGRTQLALDDSAERRSDSSSGAGWKTFQEAISGSFWQI